MNLEPFDFSERVNETELFQHLCFYHNEATNNMKIISFNKALALENFKRIYRLLRLECTEYDKVKNRDYIFANPIYCQYVNNIRNAYAKSIRVTSYSNLSSNLYDVQDYMKYGFNDIFCLNDTDSFDVDGIDNYLGRMCVIELENFELYVGQLDLKLFSIPEENVESVSILFLGKWKQLMINDIKRIKLL